MSKKQIEDFVALMSKREETTPDEIKKLVYEVFGVEVNLEVLQERKKAKPLTEDVVNKSDGFISLDENNNLSWNEKDFEK